MTLSGEVYPCALKYFELVALFEPHYIVNVDKHLDSICHQRDHKYTHYTL